MPDERLQRLYDIEATAEYLRSLGAKAVTPWTVRGWLAAGDLHAVRISRRLYITRESIDQLLARLEKRTK